LTGEEGTSIVCVY